MNKLNFLIVLMLLGAMLVKGQSPETATKINISKLTAYEKDNRIFVEWSADGGSTSNYWEVQGSADGKKFSTIALVLGPDPGKAGEQYTYKGKIERTKNYYYRVVHISPSGLQQISNIIQPAKQDPLLATTPQ